MKVGFSVACALLVTQFSFAQTSPTGADYPYRPITTATPFLTISPDARQAALGDAGVATSPDANAAYWNPAKFVFIDKKYGGGVSWTPWLGKITNDMWISYLSAFYKIKREELVAFGFKYFDMGEFYARGQNNENEGTFHPREFSLDLTYSRLLTENFSVGLTGRYIHSTLLGSYNGSSIIDSKPGNSVAVDLGVFYKKELKGAKTNSLALAAVISNIGAKISYSDEDNKQFLPTNLRVGSAYSIEVDPFNAFTFTLDFNKLLVPSPDENRNIPDKSLLEGMFGSFSDAPDGFSEEIKEIIINTGIEYWYRQTFAGRIGYFSESKEKGNRKYMTLGVGFRKERFGIDVAYLVPTNKKEHPLAETVRFSLLFQIPNDTAKEETVTDPD
ncbi:MAG: type IX secretion system outer membrane channel protein PorV [Cyclobacteriaceae bacterium]